MYMFGDAVFLSVFVGFFVCGWGVNTNLMEYGMYTVYACMRSQKWIRTCVLRAIRPEYNNTQFIKYGLLISR